MCNVCGMMAGERSSVAIECELAPAKLSFMSDSRFINSFVNSFQRQPFELRERGWIFELFDGCCRGRLKTLPLPLVDAAHRRSHDCNHGQPGNNQPGILKCPDKHRRVFSPLRVRRHARLIEPIMIKPTQKQHAASCNSHGIGDVGAG